MNTASYPSVTPPEKSDTSSPATALTSGRVLAGNTLWNLLGLCAPAIVAVLCLPILKHHLGTDRLGVLALAWVVVGYFGLFDFGLSRALTKLVADKLGEGQIHQIPSLIWTCLMMMGGMAIVGTIVTFALSPWLVQSLMKVPANLRGESLHAFYWLSVSIPIVVLTAGMRGALEALQQFRLATAIRIPLGIFTYLGPVLVLPFSHSLVPIVVALVAARALACIAHFWACCRVLPELGSSFRLDRSSAGPLFRFGTWMSVSNVVGPVMVTFDRFVIGSMISVSAVAYYAVPSEIILKLLIFPAALIGVMFPAFSTAHSGQRSRVPFLFESSVKLICVSMFPLLLAIVVFAPEGLRLWLGADFARNSTWVVRCLAMAIFICSLAQVPFAYLQSIGRPDITAKLHVTELPFYLAALFFLVRADGIRGAALAWALRVAMDAILLFFFSRKLSPENRFVTTKVPFLMAGGVFLFLLGTVPMPPEIKLFGLALSVVLCGVLLWHWVLSPRQKSLLISQLRGTHATG